MVGVVLISHGGMSEGMLSSAEMLCPNLDQLVSLSLWPADNPDDFQSKLEAKIKEVDTGDGVFVLADLMGGTPCNRAIYILGDNVRLLAGMSLPMLIAVLTVREEIEGIDAITEEVLAQTRFGVIDVNELINKRKAKQE